jgi:predicted dithiol-disulfide oxidoreductase (DUF899 family)
MPKSKAKKPGTKAVVKPDRASAPLAGRKSAFHSVKPHATKTDACLALLSRAGGATLAELQKATGWQAHSVRGFLSGTIKKMAGVTLTSEKSKTGARCYRTRKAA